MHDRFDGIDTDPERAFEQLWRRREPEQLAHVDVWFPDLPTRALLIALNTARDANPKTREDVSRLISAGDPQGWEDVMWLATQLEALPALRAGLEVDPRGPEVVSAIGLGAVAVSPEWALRRARAPRTALRLEELGRLPWRRRPRAVVRWLVPPPAIIRMRDPAARGGTLRLMGGYARRLRDGARAVSPSVRALRRMRRNSSGPAT